MSLALNSIKSVNDITTLRINSFSVDIDRKEIHIAYSELDANQAVIAQKIQSIVDPDFTAALIDANTNAKANVYAALKSSLYNQLVLATGNIGVLS